MSTCQVHGCSKDVDPTESFCAQHRAEQRACLHCCAGFMFLFVLFAFAWGTK